MVRARQRLGKYRIEARLGSGGFADVWRAYDTISGARVALKIPHQPIAEKAALEDFRREVRLTAHLDHPNILPVKDAAQIDGVFVISYPLAKGTLAQRMQRRMGVKTLRRFTDQMIAALAYAHGRGVVHCDIKPDNFLIFDDDRVRLTDFGIAKVAQRTVAASASGTVGYIAPEQALGKPSKASDVFALALVLYQMYTGALPEWPFDWPPTGYERLREVVHPDMARVLERSLLIDHRKRFADAGVMQRAVRRVGTKAFRGVAAAKRRKSRTSTGRSDWRTIQRRTVLRDFREEFDLRDTCSRCHGPVGHAMTTCPWCGHDPKPDPAKAKLKARCPRCRKGVKSDWRFCAWCYGGAIHEGSEHRYADARYVRRCSNPRCTTKLMLPFSRYCPWCRTKVRRPWKVEGARDTCSRCKWSVLGEYWSFCPWCGKRIRK